MPELPEVEDFRQILLPLVGESKKNEPLVLERDSLDKKPPRKFVSDEDIEHINKTKYYVTQAMRKGKLICLVLTESLSSPTSNDAKYLYVHMGMTGRISTSDYIPMLKELKKDSDYPPPHTYLKFKAGKYEACFSDPRKFGSILFKSNRDEYDELAPDALTEIMMNNPSHDDKKKGADDDGTIRLEVKEGIVTKLTNQSMGIKPLLLDQKRVVSGVGNWVADEILYQCQIHPDQNYLSSEDAERLLRKLHRILKTAVESLTMRQEFPSEWLFHYRWNKKQTTKDSYGRIVTFITSGGRTSAIVASIQKKKKKASTTFPEHAVTVGTFDTHNRTKKRPAVSAINDNRKNGGQCDDDAPVLSAVKKAKMKKKTASGEPSTNANSSKRPRRRSTRSS